MAQFDFTKAVEKVEANKPKPVKPAAEPMVDAWAEWNAAAAKGQADYAAKEAAKQAAVDQRASNEAMKLSGYEKQLAAAEAGEQDFAVREDMISREAAAAARNLNRQGAAAAARSKNLGTLRGMADQTGITRAQMGTEYEKQQLANAAQRRLAQQQAGALQTTLAEEKQKALVQSTTGKQDALNQKYAQIDEIAKATDEANDVLTDDEVMAAVDEMRAKVVAGAGTPEERALLEAYIQQYIKNNT